MPKDLFIFEFVSGGGFNKDEIPVSLFCEGFSMLRAICIDFKAIGFRITTLLDKRISFLHKLLPVDEYIICSKKTDYIKLFKEGVSGSNFCFIIAPEFSSILYNLTSSVIKAGKISLNNDPNAIKLASSKYSTYQYFLENHLSTPKTYNVPTHNDIPKKSFLINKLKFFDSPIIIKPKDGVGAESIFYFETKKEIDRFYEKNITQFPKERSFILQKYISGENLSVSLIGIESNEKSNILPVILSFNTQIVNFTNNYECSEYLGGYTPMNENLDLVNNVQRSLQSIDFKNFIGYFGIDFISTNNHPIYIEINPRLTTSYLGIRNILNINPAELIYKSVKHDISPDDLEEKMQKDKNSMFMRLDLNYIGTSSQIEINERVIPKLLKLFPEFLTPPLSFNSNSNYSCFLATKEKSLQESNEKVLSIKKKLREMEFEIL